MRPVNERSPAKTKDIFARGRRRRSHLAALFMTLRTIPPRLTIPFASWTAPAKRQRRRRFRSRARAASFCGLSPGRKRRGAPRNSDAPTEVFPVARPSPAASAGTVPVPGNFPSKEPAARRRQNSQARTPALQDLATPSISPARASRELLRTVARTKAAWRNPNAPLPFLLPGVEGRPENSPKPLAT